MYHCNLCGKEENYELCPHELKCALNPDLAVKEEWDDGDWARPIGYCECGGEIKAGFCPNFVIVGYQDVPRYSRTLGVFDEGLEAAKKLHPQVSDWKKFGNSWRPLIRNRAEKVKMMKQANFEEYEPKKFKGRQR